jgi:phage host-nuclease inhibitor protein Gam
LTDQLPAFLALPDGEPEPVSEAALDWLERQIAAAREEGASLEDVLAYADEFASEPESELPPRTVAEGNDRAEVREAKRLAREFRWEVDGPGTAQWAMAKLAAVEAEAGEVREQAQAWVDEIRRWEEAQLRPLTSRSAYFTERLTRWLRGLREADPKRKSYPLPSGTVSSRTVAPKVEVVSADVVAAWARAAGYAEVLKVETTVRLTEFKKVATVDEEAGVVRDPDTGGVIDGVVVHPGGVSYSVKVNGG